MNYYWVVRDYYRLVDSVNPLELQIRSLSDEQVQLKAKTAEFRERLARGESLADMQAGVSYHIFSLQLQKFRDELRNRSRVLKKLGHIDADGVVQLKGQAACLIDTGDEFLVTELMFNGTFNDLDHHQVAALASCFMPVDKSNEKIEPRNELAKPLQQLQDSARKIAEIQHECKLEVDVEEYVESTIRPFLMDVIYCWSKVEYETLPGWKSDISSIRNYADLPKAAQQYVERIEELVGVPIHYIGIGPGRDALIYK